MFFGRFLFRFSVCLILRSFDYAIYTNSFIYNSTIVWVTRVLSNRIDDDIVDDNAINYQDLSLVGNFNSCRSIIFI